MLPQADNSCLDGTFGLLLTFGSSLLQHLSSFTEAERDSWHSALDSASHSHMRLRLASLQARLGELRGGEPQAPSTATAHIGGGDSAQHS